MSKKSIIDAPGALQHIIARGLERNKILQDDFDRDNFLWTTGTPKIISFLGFAVVPR